MAIRLVHSLLFSSHFNKGIIQFVPISLYRVTASILASSLLAILSKAVLAILASSILVLTPRYMLAILSILAIFARCILHISIRFNSKLFCIHRLIIGILVMHNLITIFVRNILAIHHNLPRYIAPRCFVIKAYEKIKNSTDITRAHLS